MVKNYIEAAFVNDTPISYGPWEGFQVTERGGELTLTGFRNAYYRHPDAPDDAILSVLRPVTISTAKPGTAEYSNMYLLLHAQKACQTILNKFIQ